MSRSRPNPAIPIQPSHTRKAGGTYSWKEKGRRKEPYNTLGLSWRRLRRRGRRRRRCGAHGADGGSPVAVPSSARPRSSRSWTRRGKRRRGGGGCVEGKGQAGHSCYGRGDRGSSSVAPGRCHRYSVRFCGKGTSDACTLGTGKRKKPVRVGWVPLRSVIRGRRWRDVAEPRRHRQQRHRRQKEASRMFGSPR